MSTLKQTFRDIAGAIRYKEGSTADIPVADMAQRIEDLPEYSVGQLVRYDDFLTPQQEQQEGVLRCDGRRVVKEQHSELFELLKGDTIQYFSEVTGLPNRPHSALYLVGHKLYVGSEQASTTITVIDTRNDSVAQIPNLPIREYNAFRAVENRLYAGSSRVGVDIVVINTADDTHFRMNLVNRAHNRFAVIGNTLYIGSGATAANNILAISGANAVSFWSGFSQIPGLPNRPHSAFAVVGNRLYVGSSTATDSIAMIDTRNNNAVSSVALPITRPHNVFFALDDKLYVGTSAETTTIITINTNTHQYTQITGLPSRNVAAFHRAGDRLYIASSTLAETVGFITSDRYWQVSSLPRRTYNAMLVVNDNTLYAASGSATTNNNISMAEIVVITPANNNHSHRTQIAGLPAKARRTLRFIDDKIYVGASDVRDSLTVISTAVLPNYTSPMYIKFRDRRSNNG